MDVVGRDDELAVLRALVKRTPDAPSILPAAVVVEGAPGMGKTTLLRWTAETARRGSHAVLEASPRAAEAKSSFVALGDLLGDQVGGLLPLLAPPRRRGLAVALLLEDPGDLELDPSVVGRAVLDVIRLLAAERPVLVVLDDVQWLDADSRAALEFALRRLTDEPVALVLASRIDLIDAGSPVARVGSPLEDALPRDRVQRLHLQPLSLGALHYLIADRLGTVMTRPALRRLHEFSGGNPFYAIELARAHAQGLVRLEVGEALPSNLEEIVVSGLRALPRATQHCLAAAAALARPTIDVLDLAAGGSGSAEAALAPALGKGIVSLGEEVRFSHPLFAAAAYALLTTVERRRLHRRLAAIVVDPEEQARHLAAGSVAPDVSVAEELEATARAAFRRGATGSAAELAALAGRFTPVEDPLGRRRRVVFEAECRFRSGDAEAAEQLIATLVATEPAGKSRARLLSRLARYRHCAEDAEAAVALLRSALSEVGDEPALRVEIEAGLAWGLLLLRREIPAAVEHARSAVHFAERLGDPALLAEALAAEGLTATACGLSGRAALERAVALGPATLGLRVLRHPSFAHGCWLTCADQLDPARDVFTELHQLAIEVGDDSALPPIQTHLAMVECLAGNWAAAVRHAEEAYVLALQERQRPSQAGGLARWALAEARRGELASARAIARRSLEIAAGDAFDPAQPASLFGRGGEIALWTLGFIELSIGRHAEADRYLRPLSQALLAAGIREPGELRCLPDAIEALVGLGEPEAAEVLLGELEAIAQASARPSAMAAAAHCRGRLLALRGDFPGAVAAFEAALEHHAASPLRFERARTLLGLGELRRRMKQKRLARERLGEALAAFESLGAPVWAGRARAELARLGGRSAAEGLTEAEQRIARLVAEGRSNKEVAAALFVTPKTVETALTRIYAKLGIRSRAALVRRYAAAAEEGASMPGSG